MSRYGRDLDWVAGWLGDRGVADLERLATAMWMTRNSGGSAHQRAAQVTAVKPHIELADALAAVGEIDSLLEANVT